MQRNKREIVLPFDFQAESKIIGAILSGDNTVLNCVLGIITADDFFMPNHKAIMYAILKLEGRSICKRQIFETLKYKNKSIHNYLKSIEYVAIDEDELERLCHRVKECVIARIVIRKVVDCARRLADGDIDAVEFLQLSHASIFEAISNFHMPGLAGFESCEIMEQLPELAHTSGWYVPLIKCLQARWKKEGEQLSDSIK